MCPSKAIISNLLLSHHNVRDEVRNMRGDHLPSLGALRESCLKGRPNFPSQREGGFMQSGNREPKVTLMDQPEWAQEAGSSQSLNF